MPQVMAVGSGFGRAVGDVDSLIDKAKAMGQCWLGCIGTARALANLPNRERTVPGRRQVDAATSE